MAVRNFVFVNGRLLEAIAVMTNKKALFISIPHLEHCLISAELHPVIPLALEPKLSIPHDIDSILMIGGASKKLIIYLFLQKRVFESLSVRIVQYEF